jgi:hypothetical protein
MVMVSIQCFCFHSRGEATERSIAENWSGGGEFVLAPWEESVTQRGDIAMLARGEAAPGKKKKGDDTSWTDANFTGPKKKKINVVDSITANDQWRFKVIMSFFWKYMQVRSSFVHLIRENILLNIYHISEINYFKDLLLCKMILQMILDGCWRDMIWLNTDVDTLHTKRINLNDL